MLQIDFMTINRVVVHTVPSRAADKSYVEPTGGNALVQINPTVSEMVVGRICKSLGHHSHGIQAEFFDVGAGSMFERACSMMDGSDTEFIDLSRESAQRLAKVQQAKAFDPCKFISMSGTISASQRPFVAFIKADMEIALTEGNKGGQTVLEIMENLFMTDSQRLYKIGFVARTASGNGKNSGQYARDHHSVHIFDHLMTGTESRKAAFYFYSEFLGSDVSASDRRLTQDFYEKTLRFIKDQDFSPSKRIDLIESLRAELRSNTQSISVADFADKHLSAKDGPKYVNHMEKSKFPAHAITKDTEYVKNKLRRRQKITFTTGVQISTPADQVKNLIEITQNENGTSTVVVKGTVASNE
jgi:nucleoid-associated protein YejK